MTCDLRYLEPSAARELLRTCGRVRGARLVFADRLPTAGDDRADAEALLAELGLSLTAWRVHARMGAEAKRYGQMGIARSHAEATRSAVDGDAHGPSPGHADASADATDLVAPGARRAKARHLGVAHSRL
jgi:hypothetical protein